MLLSFNNSSDEDCWSKMDNFSVNENLPDVIGECVIEANFEEDLLEAITGGENQASVSKNLESEVDDLLCSLDFLKPSKVRESTTGKDEISVKKEQEIESADDKLAKRRAYVAAASRKTRLKRKMERMHLDKSNKRLECERMQFRKQIADLENEIQTLRKSQEDIGRINLKIENSLLRTEVKRHKAYVDRIQKMMNEFPEYSYSSEEKAELINKSIDSAINQLVSMCYTSLADTSWERLVYFPKLNFLKGIKIVVRCQLLPLGSTPETATRLNLRYDIYNASKEALEIIKQTMEDKNSDFERMCNECMLETLGLKDDEDSESTDLSLSFESLSIGCENTASTDKKKPEILSVEHYKQSHRPDGKLKKKDIDFIMLAGECSKTVRGCAFPLADSDEAFEFGSEEGEKVHIFVKTLAPSSIGPLLRPVQDDSFTRFEDSIFHGCVIRPETAENKDQNMFWTGAASYPLVGDALPVFLSKGCGQVFEPCPHYVSPQGKIPKLLRHCMEMFDKAMEKWNKENPLRVSSVVPTPKSLS